MVFIESQSSGPVAKLVLARGVLVGTTRGLPGSSVIAMNSKSGYLKRRTTTNTSARRKVAGRTSSTQENMERSDPPKAN